VGTGDGVSTYLNQYNTFQGLSTVDPNTGMASIDFLGVPFDPPGANYSRTIRISNVRGDMTLMPLNQSVTPLETISLTSNLDITVNQPTMQVAWLEPGLQAQGSQCAWSSGTVTCSVLEGFDSSFSTAVVTSNDQTGGALNAVRNMAGGTLETQNIPYQGNYLTESGFTGSAASYTGSGIGQATHGTWLVVSLSNIPAGVHITAPGVVNGASGSPNLRLYRVDVVPGWTFNPAFYASPPVDKIVVDTTGANPPTTALVVYEVVADSPNAVESASIPLTVAPQQGVNASGIQGTVSLGPQPSAPLDSSGMTSVWESPEGSLDIPRFYSSNPTKLSSYTLTLNASPVAGGTAATSPKPTASLSPGATFVWRRRQMPGIRSGRGGERRWTLRVALSSPAIRPSRRSSWLLQGPRE